MISFMAWSTTAGSKASELYEETPTVPDTPAPRAALHPARVLLLSIVSACLATALPVTAQDTDSKAHHRIDGFQNNYVEFEPKGLADLLKWKLESLRNHTPPAATTPTPKVAADVRFLHDNAQAGVMMQPAITWIGHATMLAQLGGLTLITDPVFSQRASPVGFVGPSRQVAPGLTLAELPHIDVVLISHNHYDHLDEASVRALAAQAGGPPLFIVPLGIKPWMAAR
jgi:N-acyl-phosphatidylethanolamine-hydrolysing phospholipase D